MDGFPFAQRRAGGPGTLAALSRTPAFRTEIPAEACALRRLRRDLRQWFRRSPDVRPADAERALLVVGELSSNAIEHAYQQAPVGRVDVRLEVSEAGLVARVSDHGHWRELTDEGARGRGRGRGLALVEAATDRLEIETDQYGTTIRAWVTLTS